MSWIERRRVNMGKRRKQKLMATLSDEERSALQSSQAKMGWFGKPKRAA